MRVKYIALIVTNGYVIDFSPVIYYMCINDCVAEQIDVYLEKRIHVHFRYISVGGKKVKNKKTCFFICFASCCPRLYDSVCF